MKLDLAALLQGFPRRVPVFPLADAVLFPGAVLPLHVFEPRYRTMVADVLAGDRLIALALLESCAPEEYEAAPPFHPTLCLGHVVHHEALPDGRSNIALLGISVGRATETQDDAQYRTALVQLLADVPDGGDDFEERVRELFGVAVRGGPDYDELREQLGGFLGAERVPAAMLGTCALTAPIPAGSKLELLEERSLRSRLDQLIRFLERPWQWN